MGGYGSRPQQRPYRTKKGGKPTWLPPLFLPARLSVPRWWRGIGNGCGNNRIGTIGRIRRCHRIWRRRISAPRNHIGNNTRCHGRQQKAAAIVDPAIPRRRRIQATVAAPVVHKYAATIIPVARAPHAAVWATPWATAAPATGATTTRPTRTATVEATATTWPPAGTSP